MASAGARLAITMAGLVWCGQVAAAQSASYAPACPDTAKVLVDTSVVTIGLAAPKKWRERTLTAAQQTRVRYAADAIRQQFAPPPGLGALPMLGESSWDNARPDIGDRVAVTGVLVLVTTPEGRLRVHAWDRPPLSKPLADAVLRAVLAADTAGGYMGLPGASATTDDTLAIAIESRKDAEIVALPLMRAELRSYVVTEPAMVTRQAKVDYPPMARRLGIQGEGLVGFVLGSDGRPDPGSIITLRSDWEEVAEVMAKAVAGNAYRAARSGRCTVPVYVAQPFSFSIGG